MREYCTDLEICRSSGPKTIEYCRTLEGRSGGGPFVYYVGRLMSNDTESLECSLYTAADSCQVSGGGDDWLEQSRQCHHVHHVYHVQHVVHVFVDRQPHRPESNIGSRRSITACVVVLRSRCRSEPFNTAAVMHVRLRCSADYCRYVSLGT